MWVATLSGTRICPGRSSGTTISRTNASTAGVSTAPLTVSAARVVASLRNAAWFRAGTGLACLDLSGDDDFPVSWARHNVDVLTGEWPRAKALLQQADELTAWLEDAPADHFASLLNVLLADGTVPGPNR